MLRAVLVGIVVSGAIICGAACSHDHGPPKPRPRPKPDGVTALRGNGPARSPRNASYKIEAQLDPVRHQITATETLTWTNTSKREQTYLPFHLYLNAFKNEQSLFMRSSRGVLRGARATDTGWGWIQVNAVHVGGDDLTKAFRPPQPHPLPVEPAGSADATADRPAEKPAETPVEKPADKPDPDETVAELTLAKPVGPGETVEISFKFVDQLPEVFARTGYKGDFHMVGQWFPKIGVVNADGTHWDCQPFHSNNEFFADFGTYDVTLTVPATDTVAATGVLTNAVDDGKGMRTLTYHAEDVHDFAWMADPYMEVISGTAHLAGEGTVEVRVYARSEQAELAVRHRDAAIGAIEKFSAAYVPYPWPIMSVIDPPLDAAAGAGGMEYPTLVTTGGDSVLARPGVRAPEYVTIHEVGHNWFQGILASNEPDEAWLDEGVNEWADVRAMDEIYGDRTSGVDWLGWQAEMGALRRSFDGGIGDEPSPIATPAYRFVDSTAYGEETYVATMRALETLENMVGSQRFAAAMKTYATQFAFKHPTGQDLFATLAKELGQNLDWYFQPVFHSIGGLQIKLRSAECRPSHPPRGVFGEGKDRHTVSDTADAQRTSTLTCDVIVQSTGPVHVPFDIELRFADGSTKRVRWDDRDRPGTAGTERWQAFTVERSSRLVEVWLDPDGKLALDNPVSHHYRLDGDGAASLRAGAWFGSLTQTLMQLVEP